MDSRSDTQRGIHLVTDDTQSAQVFQVTQTSPLVDSYNVICISMSH